MSPAVLAVDAFLILLIVSVDDPDDEQGVPVNPVALEQLPSVPIFLRNLLNGSSSNVSVCSVPISPCARDDEGMIFAIHTV